MLIVNNAIGQEEQRRADAGIVACEHTSPRVSTKASTTSGQRE